MPKKKNKRKGRKDRLRDINDDIMAQLFVEETAIEYSTSESSGDSVKFQPDSESKSASMNLGSKTAAIILEEMIIRPSSSHCKRSQSIENMTSLDSKLENEISSCRFSSTSNISKPKKDNSSRAFSEPWNFAPSVWKAKNGRHSKKFKKRQVTAQILDCSNNDQTIEWPSLKHR